MRSATSGMLLLLGCGFLGAANADGPGPSWWTDATPAAILSSLPERLPIVAPGSADEPKLPDVSTKADYFAIAFSRVASAGPDDPGSRFIGIEPHDLYVSGLFDNGTLQVLSQGQMIEPVQLSYECRWHPDGRVSIHTQAQIIGPGQSRIDKIEYEPKESDPAPNLYELCRAYENFAVEDIKKRIGPEPLYPEKWRWATLPEFDYSSRLGMETAGKTSANSP